MQASGGICLYVRLSPGAHRKITEQIYSFSLLTSECMPRPAEYVHTDRISNRFVGTWVSLQDCDEGRHVAHGLEDTVAVLQRRSVAVKLLGEAVKIRKAPQQILLTSLPQLRVAHKTLH